MKITRKNEVTKVSFDTLKNGDWFYYKTDFVFIKIEEVLNSEKEEDVVFNAIDLFGALYSFDSTEEVVKITDKIEIIIN